jgi:preprotein translocase subunit SecG
MEILSIIIKICVLVMAVFLVVAVLMQEGKSYGLGAIEGGADTFLGKSKGKKVSSKLSKLTSIVAIVFVVIVVALGVVANKEISNKIEPDDTAISDDSFGSKTAEPTATPAATTTPAAKTPAATTTPVDTASN